MHGLGGWKHRGNLPVLSSNWLTIARLLHSVQHFPLFLRSHFRELLLCAAGAPRWAVDPRLRQRRRQLFMPPVDAGAADAISSSVACCDPADGLMRAMTERLADRTAQRDPSVPAAPPAGGGACCGRCSRTGRPYRSPTESRDRPPACWRNLGMAISRC